MEFLKKSVMIFCLNVLTIVAFSQSYQIAVLKYKGGGDYYANPTSLPNLVSFVNRELKMNIAKETPYVEVGSTELFNYPFVHMTGHGNVVFSAADAENLKVYLMSGGFLHISDNYGLDKFIRKEMKKVFPDADFVEIPFGHPVYHQKYEFNSGLPKIHEHDNKAPQGLGIFVENRLVVFYDFECDLGDGWEDSNVHKDSEAARTKAFQMGANLLQYAFTGGK
ncbi:MAG: hypothetical protein RLZZ91_972 [Bacteroidota bacterium]|jgi:hypothetical protein